MSYYRPSWDDYFMAMARIVATRSTCDRLRAGAILIKNKRILSTGYNGAPPGLPHCDSEAGHKLEGGHCIRTLHDAENALLQIAALGGMSTEGATLYCTFSPCYHCAKKIIAARITRVVCGAIYRDPTIKNLFASAGIKFEIHESDQKWHLLCSELFTKPLEHKLI